ncbi:MAG: hypothetical protein ACK4VN_16575 [Bacteroidales bacterium]
MIPEPQPACKKWNILRRPVNIEPWVEYHCHWTFHQLQHKMKGALERERRITFICFPRLSSTSLIPPATEALKLRLSGLSFLSPTDMTPLWMASS